MQLCSLVMPLRNSSRYASHNCLPCWQATPLATGIEQLAACPGVTQQIIRRSVICPALPRFALQPLAGLKLFDKVRCRCFVEASVLLGDLAQRLAYCLGHLVGCPRNVDVRIWKRQQPPERPSVARLPHPVLHVDLGLAGLPGEGDHEALQSPCGHVALPLAFIEEVVVFAAATEEEDSVAYCAVRQSRAVRRLPLSLARLYERPEWSHSRARAYHDDSRLGRVGQAKASPT